MKFACFGYINETKWDSVSQESQQSILTDYFNYHQELRRRGIFLWGAGLKSASEGCRLTIEDSVIHEIKLNLNDLHLGGVFIIEAKDLEEAKLIITKHPGLQVGMFKVRAIDDFLTESAGAN